MKQLQLIMKILVVLLLGFMVFLSSGCSLSQTTDRAEINSPQLDNSLFVKGKVKRVYFPQNKLVIKPNKGKKMSIFFTEQTTFVGVSTPQEIENMKRVNVWYMDENGKNVAIKIENIPELGC
ncbi:MAG: hypothetical protein KQH63_19505 [Desulfobulbaceae bacterium]|nr:hypothetical protein [Desulfobulbaceae bacterium]